MKTVLIAFATALVTGVLLYFYLSLREAEWMIGAIKTPGEAAIRDIQADMSAKRYDIARQKIDILLSSWQKFSSGPDACTGPGISQVPKAFYDLAGKRAPNK